MEAERERAAAGGDDDHVTRVVAVDDLAGGEAGERGGHEETRGRGAGERHRKRALDHERIEQHRQVVEREPGRGRHHHAHRVDDVPAVEDAARGHAGSGGRMNRRGARHPFREQRPDQLLAHDGSHS